jgi:hypothetical protein
MRIGRKHAFEDGRPPEVEYRARVPGTPLNVQLGSFRPLTREVVGALALWLISRGDLGMESLWGAAVVATERIRFLGPDERDVTDFILRTEPRNAYGVGISEASLRTSYADATLDLDGVLTALEKKNVLTVANGRISLIF